MSDAWKTDKEALLRHHWMDKTASAIADLLGPGFTRSMVLGKARRLGLPPKSGRKSAPIKGPRDGRRNKEGGCQFPVGNPGDSDFYFCGAEVMAPGKPYCATHCRICYRAKTDKEEERLRLAVVGGKV